METCKAVSVVGITFFACLVSAQELPDLVPLELSAPAAITSAPSPSVQVAWHIVNQGPGEIGAQWWSDFLFVSPSPRYDSLTATYITSGQGKSYMAVGDGYWWTNSVNVPVYESGTYYLVLRANSDQNLPEADRSNNDIVIPFDFVCTPADLSPLRLITPAVVQGPPNPSVTVVWGVTNVGVGQARPGWTDRLYVSSKSELDSTAQEASSRYESGVVPPGGTYWRTNNIRLPVTKSGSYFLVFETDFHNYLHEGNTNNNVVAVPLEVDIQPPDLSPVFLQAPSTITNVPNPTVTLVYAVTNLGGPVGQDQYWHDAIVLSTDAVLEARDWMTLASEHGPVAAGTVYWRTNIFQLPVVSNGTYYVFLLTDYPSDANTNNNVTAGVPITFTVQMPDLVPLGLVPSSLGGSPYPYVTFVGGATNQGVGAATGYWGENVYVATNRSLQFATHVQYHGKYGPVPPGTNYFYTNTARLPISESGNYYLLFEVNTSRELYESDWSNNVVAVPFKANIQRPDLEAVSLRCSIGAVSAPNPYIDIVSTVTNHGPGTALGNWDWSDSIYFSTNPVWTSSATRLTYRYEQGPVDPGTGYSRTNRVLLPIVESGTYYLFLKVNEFRQQLETSYDNNLISIAFSVDLQRGDLVPLISGIPHEITGVPHPSVSLVWGVTNQGPGSTGSPEQQWYDGIYFSTDAALDGSDQSLTWYDRSGPLAAGASYFQTNWVTLPITNSGSFYLFFKADQGDSIYEQDESNNVAMVPVTFSMVKADLVIRDVQVPTVVTGSPNPIVNIIWEVQNQGGGEAYGTYNSWYDTIYLSRDAKLSPADVGIASFYQYRLASRESIRMTNGVRFPFIANTNIYLILKTDSDNGIFESDESNNEVSVPIRFEIQNPDLAPITVRVTNSIVSGPNPTVTVSWAVTNTGPGIADPQYSWRWHDVMYISTNSTFDASAIFLRDWWRNDPLLPRGSYAESTQVVLPVQKSGIYYLFLVVDPANSVCELNRSNNVVSVPVTFTLMPADLAVLSLQAPDLVESHPKPQVQVVWGITNQGIGTADGSWGDALYLSPTPELEYGTPLLCSDSGYGPILPGETYWRTNTVTMPVVESGSYYLILESGFDREFNPGNNIATRPITFQISPPDLVPFAIRVPTVVTSSINPTVTVACGVTNQGPGSTGPYQWSQYWSLWTTPPQNSGGYQVGSSEMGEPLGPGESRWTTNTLHLPITESGTYYLQITVNPPYRDLYESSYENNQLWVPITFVVQPPDLSPILFKAPSEFTAGLSPSLKLTWGVTNLGPGTAHSFNSYSPWTDIVYLSRDAVLDDGDTAIAWNSEGGPLTAGGNYWRSQTINPFIPESGSYFLILSVDHAGELHDLNYSNNTAAVPVHFTINPLDLVPIALDLPTSITCAPNTEVTFIWGVTNRGKGTALPHGYFPWGNSFYLSPSPEPYSYWALLFTNAVGPESLGGGQCIWWTNKCRLPVDRSGDFYLLIQADSQGAVAESCETNNWLVSPVTINVLLPDLVTASVDTPTNLTESVFPLVTVIYSVTNIGAGSAIGKQYWLDQLYLSRTNVIDGSETPVLWNWETNLVSAGSGYSRTNQVQLPITESGIYYLLLHADSSAHLRDANTNNNILWSQPITVQILHSDVSPIIASVPHTVVDGPYPYVSVVWGITNGGTGAACARVWGAYIYYSSTPTYRDSRILGLVMTNAIPPGGVVWFTNNLHLPIATNRTVYLSFDANTDNNLFELNTNNDVAVAPLDCAILLPDLAVGAFLVPPAIVGGIYPSVDLVWCVTNQGVGTAYTYPNYSGVGRFDVVEFSKTPEFKELLYLYPHEWDETNAVPPGGSYWRTNRVQLPVGESGTYYLKLTADYDCWAAVPDANPANNTAVMPIPIEIRPPDLAVLGFSAPAVVTGSTDPEVTVVWGITNAGPGTAIPSLLEENSSYPLADAVFLSETPSSQDLWRTPLCHLWTRTGPIPPGSSEWHTNTIRVPVSDSGSYYLVFKTDRFDVLREFNKENNTIAVPVNFRLSAPGDLAVTDLIMPASLSGPGNPLVTLAWRVSNVGVGPVDGTWADTISFSSPLVYQRELTRVSGRHLLWPGDSYWTTNMLTLPLVQSGDYKLYVHAAGDGAVFDLDPENNEIHQSFTLNVTAPPAVRIDGWHLLPGGVFGLVVYGAPGTNYQLQASSDLVNWMRVLDFVCAEGPTALYDLEGGNCQQRFYRVAPLTEAPQLQLAFGPKWWSSTMISLKLDGPLGGSYRIESSPDLLNWTTLTNLNANVVPLYFLDATATSQQQRFYRALR